MIQRADLLLCEFGIPLGHEPGYTRPAVVLTVVEINMHDTIIVAPITKRWRGYTTHVELDGPLLEVSYIQCELTRVISPQRIKKRLGVIDEVVMQQMATILRKMMQL